MPICGPKKQVYDFKKEKDDEIKKKMDRDAKLERPQVSESSIVKLIDNLPVNEPSVNEIKQRETVKKMFEKWGRLKRVKDLYKEQVTSESNRKFKDKILKQMKERIIEMPYEERKVWLTKLIRLAFLNKLKELKEIKLRRRGDFLEKLNNSTSEERQNLLSKINDLKEVFEIKELDDVQEIMQLKKAKAEKKLEKAQKLRMKIRLNRMKKLEEMKRIEEKKMREERVDKIKEIVTVRRGWEDETIKRIDKITRSLAEDLVKIQDKRQWYDNTLKDIEEEKRMAIEQGIDCLSRRRQAEKLASQKKEAKLRYEEKLKEIETWNKERKIRLWKLDQVKKFEDFLEKRYNIGEEDEERFFNKVLNKLTCCEMKRVEIDPWAVEKKKSPNISEIERQNKMYRWLQDVISSNKNKIINKVKLKKYLEIMETPQMDHIFSQAKRLESVEYLMCVVKGRIFRSTFPDKSKNYLVTECGKMVARAKLDVREIDPQDRLLNISITTKEYDLHISPGEEFILIAQQKVKPLEVPCQDRTDVLCLTKEEKQNIINLITKRKDSRKIIKEKRQEQYEAYLNRNALDKAWMKYMKSAYAEAVKDLERCNNLTAANDTVKIDIQQDDEESSKSDSVNDLLPSLRKQALRLAAQKIEGKYGKSKVQGPIKLDYNKAMDKRIERLHKLVGSEDTDPSHSYYERDRPGVRDILDKEKTVRQHMDKDLPEESDEEPTIVLKKK